MTSRTEISLAKTAELRDDFIHFKPASRSKLPESAWVRFAYNTTLPPSSFAGMYGPLSPQNRSGDFIDPKSEWVALAATLNKLLGSCLRDCPQKVSAMPLEDRQKLFQAMQVWTEQPPFHQLINNQIVSQNIHLIGIEPMTFGGGSPKGKILSTAINQMLESNHALFCKNCGELFLLSSQRPSSFCSPSCRKADHMKKHA